VADALGAALVGARRIEGGYSTADRFLVELADGRVVFAKSGEGQFLASLVRVEAPAYDALAAAAFVPRRLAYLDDDPPVLVLEDLSAGRWPPPWEPGDVEAVRSTLRLGTRPASGTSWSTSRSGCPRCTTREARRRTRSSPTARRSSPARSPASSPPVRGCRRRRPLLVSARSSSPSSASPCRGRRGL